MCYAYQDRSEAGLMLASRIQSAGFRPNTVVLGLPRGGVEVGVTVAETLGLPFDVFLVRKLGVPGHEELAMGAIASGGQILRNMEVISAAGISDDAFEEVCRDEARELERRQTAYRGARPPLHLEGRDALIVDDGLATGATMRVAVAAIRKLGPVRVLVAAPITSRSAYKALNREADACIFDQIPEPFRTVGLWYERFPQISDRRVQRLLARSIGPERLPNGCGGP
ncbi:MAG: phosphoribosyltransferase family protein [Isosphaeraceae bacterium]